MLTDRDIAILVFINRFGYLCTRHIIKHFKIHERAAYRRIATMKKEGYLHRRRVIPGKAKLLLLTQKAVDNVPTRHGRTTVRLPTVQHDLLVADVLLAIAEQHGWTFQTEREIRSKAGISAKGQVPDGLLQNSGSKQIALEVENSYKPTKRHKKVIRSYIRQPGIARVLYVCYNQQQRDRVKEIARAMKADGLVTTTTVKEVTANA